MTDLNSSLARALYQCELNLAEQERLTEQARRWAIDLESQLEQARDELRDKLRASALDALIFFFTWLFASPENPKFPNLDLQYLSKSENSIN